MSKKDPTYDLRNRLQMLPHKYYLRVTKAIQKQAGLTFQSYYYFLNTRASNSDIQRAISLVMGCTVHQVIDPSHSFDPDKINWNVVESHEGKEKVAA